MAGGKKTSKVPSPSSASEKVEQKKIVRVSQENVPAHSLEEALRVAKAIAENLGKKPAPPLRVAAAMGLAPASSVFRMLTGASIAYGLTIGGYNAPQIELSELALRILKPKVEGEELSAKRESFLRPRVIREFLSRYSGSQLPRPDIARNVLEEDLGVPGERSAQVYEFIVEGARQVRLLSDIKGKSYVDLDGASQPEAPAFDAGVEIEQPVNGSGGETFIRQDESRSVNSSLHETSGRARKVFLTHGRNRSFIEPIKKLLQFGEMDAVVSVEKQSVSQPVPEKVLGEMRSCGAAIIHVEDELHLLDKDAKEHVTLNPNVLIEIGAAMALYGKRFILLVKSGVNLPSNLQGLFEVRYEGDNLDGAATIRLLEAINELKKIPS